MKRNIQLLGLYNFFTDLRFFSAVLIIYFARVTGSLTLAMSLFSVIMVSAALFEIPTGVFSDFIGRKKTVILGALSSITSVIFYAIGENYWILFIGALFEGLAYSWYSGNNVALLHDTVREIGQEEHFAEYLGKVSATFGGALAIGAPIGSIIASWSFPAVMWLSVIPQAICLFLAFHLIEPTVRGRESGNIYNHLKISILHLWRNKKLRLVSLTSIVSFGVGEASFQFRSVFVQTLWPLWAVGIASMISYIGSMVSFWFSGRIIKRLGDIGVLLASQIYNRIINTIALLFPSVLSPIFMSSTSFLYGAFETAKGDLMQAEFTKEQRATLGSLNSLLGSLFFGVIAIVLGFIGDQLGPRVSLLVAQILLLPGIVFVLKLRNHRRSSE